MIEKMVKVEFLIQIKDDNLTDGDIANRDKSFKKFEDEIKRDIAKKYAINRSILD